VFVILNKFAMRTKISSFEHFLKQEQNFGIRNYFLKIENTIEIVIFFIYFFLRKKVKKILKFLGKKKKEVEKGTKIKIEIKHRKKGKRAGRALRHVRRSDYLLRCAVNKVSELCAQGNKWVGFDGPQRAWPMYKNCFFFFLANGRRKI
jgi:hypothetical protein